MAIIDTSYFFGPLTIAQKATDAVSGSLAWFIDDHEPRLLTDLLGYSLYKDYKAGIAEPAPAAKWTAIRDGLEYTNRAGILSKWQGLKFTEATAKKSLIANYVYWHWMENEVTTTTGTGEKKQDAQNAINVSAAQKMVRAWNQMVWWNWELVEFLLSKPDDYPEFQEHYPRIPLSLLKKQNVLGI